MFLHRKSHAALALACWEIASERALALASCLEKARVSSDHLPPHLRAPLVWFCRTDQRALHRPLIPSPGDCHTCSILTVAPGTRQEHENNRHTAQINNARNAPPSTFPRRMFESEHEDTSVQARHHWHALTFCPALALSPRSKRQDHNISFHVNKLRLLNFTWAKDHSVKLVQCKRIWWSRKRTVVQQK